MNRWKKLGTRQFHWMELLVGILFVILSICMFVDPTFTMTLVVVVLGISAILRGAVRILFFFRFRLEYGLNSWISLIAGAINILLGILLLFNVRGGILAVGILFALWFLVDAASNLLNFQFLAPMDRMYRFLYIGYNAVGVLLGLYLLFNPLASAATITYVAAVYFLICGIGSIVLSFNNIANPRQS